MSRYMKRYKYNGTLNFNYSNVRVGDKGEPDFLQQNNFQLYWQHTQDPKANPGSTFSASVDFRTSGYNRYSATSLNEALQTQTSSTISYSKSWLGTPFSLSANMSVSQTRRAERSRSPCRTSSSTFRPSTPSNARRRWASSMVRKDFAPLHRQVQQQGQRQRVRNLHQGNTPEHAVRLRA